MAMEKGKKKMSVDAQVLSHRGRSIYRPESLDDCLEHLQKYFDVLIRWPQCPFFSGHEGGRGNSRIFDDFLGEYIFDVLE